ncbi:hypothetical protein BHE74_00003428 [Ensete ventricosum]|nr:hypothetical protein GW17_00046503 [Ensete ventricosum]RWW87731.1 hypothetical protein BHE74_00003428 [Ensete ventricosum]
MRIVLENFKIQRGRIILFSKGCPSPLFAPLCAAAAFAPAQAAGLAACGPLAAALLQARRGRQLLAGGRPLQGSWSHPCRWPDHALLPLLLVAFAAKTQQERRDATDMIGLMVAEVCNLGTIRLKVAEVCNSGTIGLKVTEVCNSGTIRLKVVEVCDLGTIGLKVTDVYDSGTIGLKVAEVYFHMVRICGSGVLGMKIS